MASSPKPEHVRQKLQTSKSNHNRPSFTMNPCDLLSRLNKSCFGQESAKRTLAMTASHNIIAAADPDARPTNILMQGPTGTGKTLLGRTLARVLGVPFLELDATAMVAGGYRGGTHLRTAIRRLVDLAKGDLALASQGWVYVDEIDKIRETSGGGPDVRGKLVQDELLKLIEGTELEVKGGVLPTRGITFLVGGAFSGIEKHGCSRSSIRAQELIAYGLTPELVGRFPVRIALERLTAAELKIILMTSPDSPLVPLQRYFDHHAVELDIHDSAFDAIAQVAYNLNTGARALEEVTLKVLEPLQWELCESNPPTVALTAKDVLNQYDNASSSRCAPDFTVSNETLRNLGWETATHRATALWEDLEQSQPEELSWVAPKLVQRRATLDEFFEAFSFARTSCLRAVLHYLDYARYSSASHRRNISRFRSSDGAA